MAALCWWIAALFPRISLDPATRDASRRRNWPHRCLARARCTWRLHAGGRPGPSHLVCPRPSRHRRRGSFRLAAPVVIEADAAPNPGGWPKGGQTVVTFRNEHLSYAITWFGLAAGLHRRLSRLSHVQGPAALELNGGRRRVVGFQPVHFDAGRGAASQFRRRPAGRAGAGWRALYAGGLAAFQSRPRSRASKASATRMWRSKSCRALSATVSPPPN